MLKIGFDKNDPECRKFYFDDDMVLTSNPPKYKIWYVDDETDIDYVPCADVFFLRPVNIEKEHVQTPIKVKKETKSQILTSPSTEVSTIHVPEPPKTTIQIDDVEFVKNGKPVEIKTEPKKRGRKKKEQEKNVDNVQTVQNNVEVHVKPEFEYKVIDEYLNDVDDLENMLNTYGRDGWELCGFEIYKTGIYKQTSILCILKRNKRD